MQRDKKKIIFCRRRFFIPLWQAGTAPEREAIIFALLRYARSLAKACAVLSFFFFLLSH